MKMITQAIRFQRLGCSPIFNSRLVNDETMKAEEEIVVARKMKHDRQKIAHMIILNGKVVMTAAMTAACPWVFNR